MEEREITKFQETTYWKLHNIFISLNELSKHSKDDKVKKKMDDLLTKEATVCQRLSQVLRAWSARRIPCSMSPAKAAWAASSSS